MDGPFDDITCLINETARGYGAGLGGILTALKPGPDFNTFIPFMRAKTQLIIIFILPEKPVPLIAR